MKTIAVCLIAFVVIQPQIFGEEKRKISITTTTGKTFTEATIKRAEIDALIVSHPGGIARIPFTELSAEIQEQYGYSEEKVAAARMLQQKANAEKAEPKRKADLKKYVEENAINLKAEVYQIEADGFYTYSLEKHGYIRPVPVSGDHFIAIKTKGLGLYDGLTLLIKAAPNGTITDDQGTVKAWTALPGSIQKLDQ